MTLQLNSLLKQKLLIFDGAMGTELYARHIFTNRSYDELCLSNPALVSQIHQDYIDAGADVITTNSFGANAVNLRGYGLADKAAEIARAAAIIDRKVADAHTTSKILVAGSLGPIPAVASTHEARVDALCEQARALIDGGADFLIFETLPSRDAAEEASLAMKALNTTFPFVLSYALQDDGCTEPLLRQKYAPFPGLPTPDAVGMNCGCGPDSMLNAVEIAVKFLTLPLIVQPNAGVPRMREGRQLYLCSPEYLFTYAMRYVTLGARAVGGCCGTTPAHIRELARAIKPLSKITSTITVHENTAPETALAPEKPLAERSRLGQKLATGQWITMIEMAPPTSWNTEKYIAKAKLCAEHGIDTLNVPDGPRASPRLSALVAALLIQEKTGMETVLHICGRDRNMIGLQADMLGAAACGIHNILMITGDPPKLGNYSFASGVFDTDSIGLVRLQKYLNRGVDLGGQPVKPPTETVVGVGADPCSIDFEREVRRIHEKAAAGADYITTQPVFDPDPLFKFLDAIADVKLPVIAGIWPLVSLRNAQFMRNEVPGVTVPDAVMRRMAEPATGEGQLAVGLQIAREAVAAVRPRVAGVQLSTPLGKLQAAFDVLQK